MESFFEDLKQEIQQLKTELQEVKSKYEELVIVLPDLLQENLTLALKDYQFLKKNNCCCFKRK